MRSSVLALTGQVWRQYRWVLAACAAVWLVHVAAAALLATHRWPALAPVCYYGAPASALATMAVALAAFSFTDGGPINRVEGAFPARLFLLPLPTPALVFWPMAQAAAVAAAVWVAYAAGVTWPTVHDLPVVWPALLAATAFVWLQAACWVPLPTPGLRLVALLCVGGVGLIPALAIKFDAPPVVAPAALAALLPAAYLVALAGVRRARRGDTPEWAWPGRAARWLSDRLPWRRAGFASPLDAQAWFEWRLRGWGLPMVAGIMLGVWLPLFPFWDRAMTNVLSDEVTPTLKAAVGWLSAPGLLLLGTVAWLPLYAGALATDLGGMRFVGRRPTLAPAGVHPLLGLKPLTARGFVLAKWRMALRATLWASAVVLLPAVAAYTATHKWAAVAAAPAFAGYGPAGAAVVLLAVLAMAHAATWVQLVGGLWVGLWGKGWLSTVAALMVAMGWLPLGYAAYWLWSHPEWMAWLPVAACAAVVLKLLLAGGLLRAVVRDGHATAGEAALAAVAWVGFAAGCVALVLVLVPPGRASPAAVALGVAVLLPFNRVVAAPLLLAQNRRR